MNMGKHPSTKDLGLKRCGYYFFPMGSQKDCTTLLIKHQVDVTYVQGGNYNITSSLQDLQSQLAKSSRANLVP